MLGDRASTVETIRVFGSTRAVSDSGAEIKLPPKSRNMLALLIAGGPDGLTTEQILDEVADGDRSQRAQSKVRMDLSRLRQRIGEGLLPPGQGRWRIVADSDSIDHYSLLERPPVENLSPIQAQRLLTGAAFRESGHTPLIQAAIQRTATARIRLLDELLDRRPDLLTDGVLDAIVDLVESDPFDDEFASLVLQTLVRCGEQPRARKLLSVIELAFSEDLNGASPGLDPAVRRQVLSRKASTTTSVGPLSPVNTGVQPDPFVGRGTVLNQLLEWSEASGSATAVVTGRAGIGKSRLLNELAALLSENGRTVIRIAGRETARSALEPWREGMPALGPHLTVFLDSLQDSDLLIARARLWDAARAELVAMNRPIVLVDDAQWFDSLSRELSEFLIRTAGSELQLLLAGRPPSAGDWSALHDAAKITGNVIELQELSRTDLEELIGHLRPKSRLATRSQFAVELEELSGGLPAVARPIVESALGDGLHAPASTSGSALAPIIQGLDRSTREVALTLAVLGLEATWDGLTWLADVSERELLDACATLSHAGLATFSAGEEPRISLTHIVVRDAILEVSAETDRWRLHREAAALATTIHRRAEHEFLAHPLVPEETSRVSLLKSADTHVATGALREAITAFHRARLRLGDDLMPVRSLIVWAGSLDRLGLQGHRVRVEAVTRAMDEGDVSLALDAALSGLPEAEVAAGDPNRLALLRSIPGDELPPDRRFDHAHATGRQLAVLGESVEARQWLDRAAEYAESESQRDTLLLALWLADYAHRGHRERIRDRSFYPTEDALSVWAAHLRGIDLLGAADLPETLRSCNVVRDTLAHEQNPYLAWHNRLLQATAALSDGRLEDATQLSDGAFEHGVRYGLRESGSAWLAQVFMSVWMQRGASELTEQMRRAQGDVEGSVLAEAAFAVALHDNGDFDDAMEAANLVAERAIGHRSFAGVASLLLVSRVIRNDHRLSKDIYELLRPVRSSLVVVGGGFACLGPADMALGLLAGESPSGPHFTSARALVDDHDIRGWRIAVRLELARTFGDAKQHAEAVSLSAGLGWELGTD